MKRLCYLGILKEGFLAYSSPVMLISRKVMHDKGVVIDLENQLPELLRTTWHTH